MFSIKQSIFAAAIAAVAVFAVEYSSVPTSASGAAQTAAPKFALLVGINRYKTMPRQVTELSGAHNDVALMKSFLIERGFAEELKVPKPTATAPCGDQKPTSNVKTLCSEQATKQAILDTFDSHLVGNAKDYWKGQKPEPSKGPTVVFYYSGHGSQVRDRRAIEGEKPEELILDEPDGKDETLVAHDSDLDGVRDIRDDAFEQRIKELKKYTANITFISDSCHSATITRGSGMKGIERSFTDVETTSNGTRSGGAAQDGMLSDPGYVTISGSLPTQFSYEIDLPSGENKPILKNGILTYFFVNLSRANPDASYRELIGLIRNAAVTTGKPQTPQAEGAIDRSVFGSAGSTAKRGIAVKCTGTGAATICSEKIEKKRADGTAVNARRINMEVGSIVGARVGGPIVVYAPNATELTGDANKIATGTITSANAFISMAEIEMTDAKAGDIPARAKVVLLAPSFSDAKRKVAVDIDGGNDAGTANMRKLIADLQKSAYFAPVEKNGILASTERTAARSAVAAIDWEIAIARGRYDAFKVGRSAAASDGSSAKSDTPADSEIGYFIVDTGGLPLYDLWIKANDPGAADRLRSALEAHIKAQNVRSLKNEASKLNGKVTARIIPYKNFARNNGDDCADTPFSADELASMTSETPNITRNQAFSVEITNRAEKPLWFYIYSVDAVGRVDLTYPMSSGAHESIGRNAVWSVNGGNRCTLYHFTPESPTGFEMIKIIVSENQFAAELLTSSGVRSGAGSDSLLGQMLMQARDNTRATLGGGGSVGDWATIDLTYNVVP